jgi:hypothetical protein
LTKRFEEVYADKRKQGKYWEIFLDGSDEERYELQQEIERELEEQYKKEEG